MYVASCCRSVWHALAQTLPCYLNEQSGTNNFPQAVNIACRHPRLLDKIHIYQTCRMRYHHTSAMASSNFANGGFGLTYNGASPVAFLSSWACTIHTLVQWFPDLKQFLNDFQNPSQVEETIKDLCSVLPPGKCLSYVVKDKQHRLTEQFMKPLVNDMIENSSSIQDQSRLSSLQGKGAGTWLLAVPTSSVVALCPCNYCLAKLMRLGCMMPVVSGQCDCGKELDQEGYHLVMCKTGEVVFSITIPWWQHGHIAWENYTISPLRTSR